jgi:hypothetical protein
VLVVIVIAAVVVVAVVVFLARGRGGGLSAERNDYLPLDLGPVTATDVALLRPSTGLWGYNMQATDEAMEQIAESIKERDVRIVALEQLVTDLSRGQAPMPLPGSHYAAARNRGTPAETADAGTESTLPHRDAPATLPHRDVPATLPHRDVPATLPHRDVPATLPHRDAPPAEPVGFSVEAPRPGGELSGPPERSHD